MNPELPGIVSEEKKESYPAPTYEQLESKLYYVSRKSNRRRAALRQLTEAYELLKRRHDHVMANYKLLADNYDALWRQCDEDCRLLDAELSRPWWKFW